jgi:hypothetical protein
MRRQVSMAAKLARLSTLSPKRHAVAGMRPNHAWRRLVSGEFGGGARGAAA